MSLLGRKVDEGRFVRAWAGEDSAGRSRRSWGPTRVDNTSALFIYVVFVKQYKKCSVPGLY